jgi:heme-degrading monooxygenase HmoA
MDQQMATTLRPGGEPAHAGSRWKTHEQNQPRSYWEGQGLNSRAVEFIAKAGMSSQLRDCFDGPVLKFLEGLMGFRGTLVLTPHQEPRRILVLSFWKTERHCRETEWELADQVQEQVGRSLTPSLAFEPTRRRGGHGSNQVNPSMLPSPVEIDAAPNLHFGMSSRKGQEDA